MKFIGIFLAILLLGSAVAWYSMQSLPTWFNEQASKEQQAVDALSRKISEQGVGSIVLS